jgi:transposase-like protein
MVRRYTKVEELAEVVRVRHEQGETYAEIATSYGLRKKQLKQLIERQRRKERKIAAGYIPRPKGRPRKEPTSEEVKRNNEIVQLRMQVELLRNFLLEVGRR